MPTKCCVDNKQTKKANRTRKNVCMTKEMFEFKTLYKCLNDNCKMAQNILYTESMVIAFGIAPY